MVGQGYEGRGKRAMTANGHRASSGGDEDFLKLIVMMHNSVNSLKITELPL